SGVGKGFIDFKSNPDGLAEDLREGIADELALAVAVEHLDERVLRLGEADHCPAVAIKSTELALREGPGEGLALLREEREHRLPDLREVFGIDGFDVGEWNHRWRGSGTPGLGHDRGKRF